MERRGIFAPETEREARERYESVGPVAQIVVRETTTAIGFDREEYEERVDSDVIETARDAIFASLLEVRVGSAAEFETWCEDHPDYERNTIGSENVEGVVWHATPTGTVLAATFQDAEDAAVATLRRRAFGSIYRELL